MTYQGKVAVVTGGARGIGRATAELLSREGCRVVICDLELNAVNAAVQDIHASGREAFGVIGDVRDPEAVKENVRQVMERYGKVDILVNNAGGHTQVPIENISGEQWRRELDVVLTGSFNWAQAVGTASMIPQGEGVIVNVGSGAGLAAIPDAVAYVSAKHGVIGLTRALAVDWAQYGIRVNCVCPGFTWTELARKVKDENPELLGQRIDRIPLGNGAQPEDIANAIEFFTSERSRQITGVVLPVDGGIMAMESGYSAPRRVKAES
ncbi:SDR family oxidoreductase [Arthrobacter sp. AK01]|uniref:SDR family NAD(P)-dependent oxidoreductase n=1 Tax=Arthrobacter sp. AK01 TaxID=2894084 RepID=UPI001E4834FF|nr:SDR family oxidoreductase [Arthrobacter sp. AK01]MCD4850623.1 SDR family oxidoreductase [Arthrobacter sp. AK01]